MIEGKGSGVEVGYRDLMLSSRTGDRAGLDASIVLELVHHASVDVPRRKRMTLCSPIRSAWTERNPPFTRWKRW